jgi:hypothetical protein
MILVPTIEQFNIQHIYVYNPVKNNIMDDSRFIRIIYSNPMFVLNALYLAIDFNDSLTYESYYNKFKYSFDVTSNKKLIDAVKTIEEKIIHKLQLKKKPKYQIYDQLSGGNIKLFGPPPLDGQNREFVLKISGVWETDTHYGLTYKFINSSLQND